MGERARTARGADRWIRTAALTGTALLAISALPVLTGHPHLAAWSVVAIAIIAAVILVHECAHALAARLVGMDVDAIHVGCGPQLARTRLRGLVISWRLLPLGGSARIAGMSVESAQGLDPRRTYVHAPTRSRLIVALAGIAANLLSAWVALSLIAAMHGHGPMAPARAAVVLAILVLGGLRSLGALVAAMVTGGLSALTQLDSILALPTMLTSAAEQADTAAVALVAFAVVSISVAVVNIAPLAPLDGFLVLTTLLDGIRKRRHPDCGPLPMMRLRWLVLATAAPVISLGLWLLGRDILALLVHA